MSFLTSDLVWQGNLLNQLGHFLRGAHWTELKLLADLLEAWHERAEGESHYRSTDVTQTALVDALADVLSRDHTLPVILLTEALTIASSEQYRGHVHDAVEALQAFRKRRDAAVKRGPVAMKPAPRRAAKSRRKAA